MVAAGALVTSCSDNGETVADGVSAGPEQDLLALFPRDVPYLAAESPSRLVYTLVDVEGIPFATIDEPVTFTISFDGEQVGEPIEVAPRNDGTPRPYLPVPFTFPRPGIYDIGARYGSLDLRSQVQVNTADEIPHPLVGNPLPAAPTATPGQTYDVDPLCTRGETCPFHQVDLQQALGKGRPVVVLLATPAYCRTEACGPTLELLVEAAQDRDDLVVIHSEVYKNPKGVADLSQAELAPLPLAYDLRWEPSLFVTDSAGTLVARADIVVDRSELSELLALAV
jgi:hypothetical protein